MRQKYYALYLFISLTLTNCTPEMLCSLNDEYWIQNETDKNLIIYLSTLENIVYDNIGERVSLSHTFEVQQRQTIAIEKEKLGISGHEHNLSPADIFKEIIITSSENDTLMHISGMPDSLWTLQIIEPRQEKKWTFIYNQK